MTDTTTIPAPRVPFIDGHTGLISREWYRFLLNLFTLTGTTSAAPTTTDLEVAPLQQLDLSIVGLQNQVAALELQPVQQPSVAMPCVSPAKGRFLYV